jgi:homocysteine S-methyltransferase
MDALVESGVDLLILETFQNLNDLSEAILAAREAAGPEMVVVAHLSVEEDGSLACGASIREYSTALEGSPADVIGLNCSFGPHAILETLEKMAAWTTKPLSAMPSAGLPGLVCAPEYLAGMASDFLRAGARMVGGCCGTTPEHIRQIRAVLDASGSVRERVAPAAHESVEEERQPLKAIPAAARSGLGSRLASRQFVGIVEMLLPRGPDASGEIAAATGYKQAGIEFVAIPEGPRAAAACHIIQQLTGVESIMQLHSGHARAVQSELLAAHALGIRNILCAGSGSAVVASNMTASNSNMVASNLNRGLDFGGRPLGSQTSFLIGIMLKPSSLKPVPAEPDESLDPSLHDADFVITEPIFDLDVFDQLLKRLETNQLPVIASIRPLTGLRDAEFLIHERDTPVAAAYLNRLREARNAPAEGLAIAGEMVERMRRRVAGIYLRGTRGAGQLPIQLAQAIGSRP